MNSQKKLFRLGTYAKHDDGHPLGNSKHIVRDDLNMTSI
jgi:hypothetical protein